MAHYTRQNMKIHYEYFQQEKHRDKPTLILIHGFLASSFSYRHLVTIGKNEYNILTIDLPPFGESGKHFIYSYTYKNLADTVLHLLQTLNIKRSVVVGHSMGGQIALRMYQKSPNLIEKMILIGSSAYYKKLKPSHIFATYSPLYSMYFKQYIEWKGMENILSKLVYHKNCVTPKMIEGYKSPFQNGMIYMSIVKLLRQREGDLSSDELKRIKVPVLLVWGEYDEIVPVDRAKQLQIDLSHAELRIYPNTGHMVPEEKPFRLYRDISDFIEKKKGFV